MKGNTYQRRLLFMVLVLCWLSSGTPAYPDDLSYHFQPGVRISSTKPLTTRELNCLIRELSSLSGLRLKVDVDRTIHYDHAYPAVGGSAVARELLGRAIDSSDSFTIESANQSKQIAFAQIESTTNYKNGTNPMQTEWVIRIDFADYAQLGGDAAALKAFNPGINLMHELAHAILKLPDPERPNDPLGQCELYLNLMRAELGLPLRQHYFPRTRMARNPASLSQVLQGELKFTHGDPDSKKKELLLTFNVSTVVDIERMKSIPPDLFAMVKE